MLEAACAGDEPGVVFVDDVNAADEATLDVLGYVARRLRRRPMLVVLSWRSEGVPPGHRLRRLAADLGREGRATLVTLARLDETDVSRLVRSVMPGVEAELERRVYLESEGLPVFVAEYLAVLEAGGRPDDALPPSEMRGLVEARLSGLGAMERQLLETAAVIGRSFGFDTVRAASGRSDDETMDGLEALVTQGLVREGAGPEPAYDFTHEKLRTLVYDEVGPARRRLLHRRVADALARTERGDEGAALIAQHLRLGGDAGSAAQQYRRAGEHAAALLAHADALEHLEAALALGYPDAAGLQERIGDLRTLVGDYARALAAYETAAAHVARRRPGPRSSTSSAGCTRGAGDWERAEARYTVALESLGGGDAGLRARILADRSLMLHQSGRSTEAAELAKEAAAIAEEAGDLRAQAQAHNLLGVLARAAGELTDARAELERSLTLARDLGEDAAKTAALNNLALVARDAGEPDRALELTEAALELCASQGDRHREAALENNLADLHHDAGRDDQAMAHLKRAVALFSEVGADEDARLPEIWKLVSW